MNLFHQVKTSALERQVQARTAELGRSNRALRMISECNQALVRATDEAGLLHAICRLAVEHGSYRMAWVGFAEQDGEKTVRPAAEFGFEEGYLDTVNITWADVERGRGPTGTAIRTGQPVIARNIPTDPAYGPWRAAAVQHGYVSSIALPLQSGDRTFGALNIYAAEPDAFNAEEVPLLSELANDLAFGIQALREREERQRAEEETSRRSHELALISALVNATATTLDLPTVLDRALRGALELTGLEGGTLCLVNQDRQSLELAAQINTSPETIADLTSNVIRIGDCLCGNCARTCQPLILWDNASGSEFATREATRNEGIRFHAAFPLLVQGRCIAVLCVFARNEAKPTERSLKLAQDLCGPIALAIENARLYEALQQELAERQRVEAALRHERQFLAAVLDNIGEAVVACDARGVLTRFNQAARTLHGLPEKPIPPEQWAEHYDLYLPDEKTPLRKEDIPLFRALQGEQVRDVEMVVTPKHGAARTLVASGQPMRDARGQLLGAVAAMHDITARKQAEETVLRERDFSEAILNSLPGVVYCYDQDFRFRRWNKTFEQVLGYTAAEIARLSPLDFFAGPDKELLAARIAEVFEKGVSDVEADFVAKDGTRTPYYFTGLRTTIDGKPHLVGVGIDITARKRAEAVLRESEERLRLFAEQAPAPIAMLDENLNYVATSQRWLAEHNREDRNLIGRNMYEVFPDIPEHWKEIHRRCLSGAVESSEADPWVRADGGTDWVRWEMRPWRKRDGAIGGLVVFSEDITENKKVEVRLHESEARLRLAVAGGGVGLWEWDAASGQLIWNDQLKAIFGLPAETTGLTLEDFVAAIHPDDRANTERIFRAALEQRTEFKEEYRICRPDGTVRWIMAIGRGDYDATGQPLRMRGAGLDITDRKQAEEEVRRLHEDLQHHATELEQRVARRTAELAVARDLAEAADRTKSAFLATMSHELRTPLNSVIGFTGILLQGLVGPLNAEQTKQLGMVKESGRHLLALINDVLDISKIEAGQIEIRLAPFDLPESIQKVAQTVAPLAGKKQLPLVVRVAPDTGQITSDRRRVEQILLNLLSNAIKFSEHGQVTLTAEISHCALRAPHSEISRSALRISIADTGIGIQPEDLGKLFQPFRQLDSGLTRQHEGTGLGLAISKRLVEKLGGEIGVLSEPGQGSTFWFTLPLGR